MVTTTAVLAAGATMLGAIAAGAVAFFTQRQASRVASSLGEELRSAAEDNFKHVTELGQVKGATLLGGDEEPVNLTNQNRHYTFQKGLERSALQISISAAKSSSRDTNLYTRYADEAVARSRITFWIAFSIGIVGVIVVLVGVVLLIFGTGTKTAGIYTSGAGIVESSISALLYKRSDSADIRAGEWFDKASKNLDKADSLQRALNVCNMITDVDMREKILGVAAMGQLFPDGTVDQFDTIASLKKSGQGTRRLDSVHEPSDDDQQS
jgi:hypothetical protein